MERLRLGLIGCGGMGAQHSTRFAKMADRTVVTAAAEIQPQRRNLAAQQLPGAKIVSDYHDLLNDVDAVLIALPHHLHHRATLDCLEAGKHVLLEKPMANSEQQCLDLIAAQQCSGLTLMIAYCMRFHPLVSRMKQLLDKNQYGECFQVSIWTEQFTDAPEGHWFRSAEQLGGGQFFSHGCHYIDILLWLLGRPVRGVHIGTNLCTPWMEKEGTSNATLEFEGGRLGYHFGTWGARGSRLRYSIHAHCETGLLEAAISDERLYFHQGTTTQTLMECENIKHTELELAHFLDCIETEQPPLTDANSALQGLRIIWRLYEAENQNTMADLRGLELGAISQSQVKNQIQSV